MSDATDTTPEISIVMPCLDEAETLEACITKARRAADENELDLEIVIADNGSTDGSQEIARRLGARVVDVKEKGYGSALRGGIAAARGRFIIMGDADDSYDFSAIAPFVEKLREGYELVMGNRFLGGIEPDAMPWKHRWIGNPVLTAIGRIFFHAPAGDFHCGLRGFSRDAYQRMKLETTGMEFASEMVVRASLLKMRIAEVPIVLHKDGRSRPPHLRSWRDGWRHLRFMLLLSPRWLFLLPGLALVSVGTIASIVIWTGPLQIGDVVFDIHTLLLAGFAVIAGFQLVVFGIFTKAFAMVEGIHPPDPALSKLLSLATLERGVIVGVVLLIAGAALLGAAITGWSGAGFGSLDARITMRQVIPSTVLMMLGIQTIFAAFFLSILSLKKR